MRPHIIVGHFGAKDQLKVPATSSEFATYLNLTISEKYLDHGIGNSLKDLAQLGIFPSEVGLDMLILAAHVHAADTRISRVTESQDTWTREIHLIVPVSNTDRYRAATPLLERMLNFLTGDLWTIEFYARPLSFASLILTRPSQLPAILYNDLALFSGGLDSAIGAIDMLEANRAPLMISHVGDGATSDAQSTCYQILKNHYTEHSLDRLRVWMNFPTGLVDGIRSENTTRGRSFLFFAIGVFAGTGLEADFTLNVPENGFIALNVPLDPLRLGSLSTRTTHPFYMACWNELLEVLEIPGRITNPYWNKTKGEMVEACANPELLLQLIPQTLSCSSPTKGRWQRRGNEHCGYCLPCLIRRAALEKGLGQGADPTSYNLANISEQVLNTNRAKGQQVRSFQFAISRLQSDPTLAKLLIHKPGPLSKEPPAHLDAFAGVYKRGMDEVAALLSDVHTQPS